MDKVPGKKEDWLFVWTGALLYVDLYVVILG